METKLKAYFTIGMGRQKWAQENAQRLQAEVLSISGWNYDWDKWKRQIKVIRRFKTNVIIDHHLLSAKARKKYIKMFKGYEKIAVVMPQMKISSLDEVTIDEGFDHLWIINNDGSVDERW